MMSNNNNSLFSQTDLNAYLNTKWAPGISLIEQVTPAQLQATGARAVAQGIVAQLRVEPLVLDTAAMKQTDSTVTLNVSARPAYGERDRGPVPQLGHQVRVVMPFTGNADLWGVRPSNMGSGLTPCGTVDAEQRTLTLTFEHTDAPSSNWYARKLDEMLQRIAIIINLQNGLLDQEHAALDHKVQQALIQP